MFSAFQTKSLLAGVALLCCSLALARASAHEQRHQQQQAGQLERKDINEEMNQINRSLEGLLSELAVIKREAAGRLSQNRNKPFAASSAGDLERLIRQTKVSKFVLKRVAELELESQGMRNEMVKLFDLQRNGTAPLVGRQQEALELDFDEATSAAPGQSTAGATTASGQATTTTTTTTMSPEQAAEEAKQIGFDLEALKRLGSELESEIEARQAQRPESLRGVHEQLIRLVDNMVQTYLGNTRRALQRFQRFVDGRARQPGGSAQAAPEVAPNEEPLGGALLAHLEALRGRFREFGLQWARAVAKQQSPLLDRIPPRGVELWRDFWDTVRAQMRRINAEFQQVSRDMGRLLTGRPSGGLAARSVRALAAPEAAELSRKQQEQQQEKIREQFQEFYDKLTETLSREQQRMELQQQQQQQGNGAATSGANQINANELFDEQDDEQTRQELTRNVALRQQIQQEINVFGSIFDIMRQFIQRLRESATHIRDVLTPPGASNNNDAVTPGPSVKPAVDQLLEETINSQREINGQAKPMLLPTRVGPQRPAPAH